MRLLLSSLIALCLTAWAAPVFQDTSLELSARDLWPRAPPPPHEQIITLTMDGKTFKMRKNPTQGTGGVVYQVLDGPYKGGYAKTRFPAQEVEATSAVGALWKYGMDDQHRAWIIVKPSPGKRIEQTSAYTHVRHNPKQCWALMDRVTNVATDAIMDTYKHTHWLHQDLHFSNILFNDQASRAYLIDWGRASQPPRASRKAVEEEVACFVMAYGRGLCGEQPAPVRRRQCVGASASARQMYRYPLVRG